MTQNDTVQRTVRLSLEHAEWLREHAFRLQRPQADIIRQALAEYRARTETETRSARHERNRALTDRFALGTGIDLEVLRDEEMWIQGVP
jgi:predicted transcriptional regulator